MDHHLPDRHQLDEDSVRSLGNPSNMWPFHCLPSDSISSLFPGNPCFQSSSSDPGNSKNFLFHHQDLLAFNPLGFPSWVTPQSSLVTGEVYFPDRSFFPGPSPLFGLNQGLHLLPNRSAYQQLLHATPSAYRSSRGDYLDVSWIKFLVSFNFICILGTS